MKSSHYIILALVVILALAVGYVVYQKQDTETVLPEAPIQTPSNPKDISYEIDHIIFTLVNGYAEQPVAPDSASKSIVRMFGEPVYGDLDGDSDEDAAVLLTYDGGGSGTFYYAALAIKHSDGYRSTNVLLLGDRIAPQTVEIHEGKAVFNYAERKVGEPMTTAPSVGKSLWIHLDSKKNEIGELVKDFEGEANSTVMSLSMKQWTWVRTEYADGTIFTPQQSDAFKLTMKSDGTFGATTDCNSMGGSYANTNTAITFTDMMSTLMFCENSDEATFSSLLSDAQAYRFTSKGELLIDTAMGQKTAIFR